MPTNTCLIRLPTDQYWQLATVPDAKTTQKLSYSRSNKIQRYAPMHLPVWSVILFGYFTILVGYLVMNFALLLSLIILTRYCHF